MRMDLLSRYDESCPARPSLQLPHLPVSRATFASQQPGGNGARISQTAPQQPSGGDERLASARMCTRAELGCGLHALKGETWESAVRSSCRRGRWKSAADSTLPAATIAEAYTDYRREMLLPIVKDCLDELRTWARHKAIPLWKFLLLRSIGIGSFFGGLGVGELLVALIARVQPTASNRDMEWVRMAYEFGGPDAIAIILPLAQLDLHGKGVITDDALQAYDAQAHRSMTTEAFEHACSTPTGIAASPTRRIHATPIDSRANSHRGDTGITAKLNHSFYTHPRRSGLRSGRDGHRGHGW